MQALLKNVYYCFSKYSKVHIHIVQITNYILNDILSNFMVNKKVKHKNATMGKNDICSPTLILGWSIREMLGCRSEASQAKGPLRALTPTKLTTGNRDLPSKPINIV
jgi:hypothetical protein